MTLQSLRPRVGTDLVQLQGLLGGGDWRASMPSALPEKVLLSLALDLRTVECSGTADLQEELSLAPALFVTLQLMMQNPERKGGPSLDLKLSESALMSGLRSYQWAVEREIVSRIVGLSSTRDAESLLAALAYAAESPS